MFLLIMMNRADLLGEFKNGTVADILGVIIVLFAIGLGIRTIYFALLTAGVIG